MKQHKSTAQLLKEHYAGLVSRSGEAAVSYAKEGNAKYAQIYAARAAALYRELVEKRSAL